MKWYWVYWKPKSDMFGKQKYQKYAPAPTLEKARLIALSLELMDFDYIIVEEE